MNDISANPANKATKCFADIYGGESRLVIFSSESSMDGHQANTVFSASNCQDVNVTAIPPGCMPPEIVLADSIEDLMAGTASTSSFLDVSDSPQLFLIQNGRCRSTSDPSRRNYFINQKCNQKQQQLQNETGLKGDIMAATTLNIETGLPRQANVSKTTDAIHPLGRNRGHSTENLLRVAKEAWIQIKETRSAEESVQTVPPIEPTSPLRKIFSRIGRRVSSTNSFNRVRGRRTSTKVQTIATDVDKLPELEEQVNDCFYEGGTSQDGNTGGATAILKPSLVQTDVSTSNQVLSTSMANTRGGQQLTIAGGMQLTALATEVGEPSNIAEGLLDTASTSMLNEYSMKLRQVCLQHDDMALESFLTQARVAGRRLAVCEELEAALNTVKINGCRVSLIELRKDLASFQPRKAKSMES